MLFRMATGTLVNERLPSVLGILPSTLERLLRALQVAGLLPKGQPGGGRKGAAHLKDLHLSYVMLGCAGLQPSEAPDAVRSLRSVPWRWTNNASQDVGAALPTLEDMLAYWIDRVAQPYRQGGQWFPGALVVLRSWQIQLCLAPLHAIITVQTTAGETTHVYAADPTLAPGLRRLTILSGDVLLAAGELLADTEKHLALTTPSFLDQVRANASLESNNAGHPRQGVPASMNDQPTPMGPAASPPRKVSAKTKIFKDAPMAGLVTTR